MPSITERPNAITADIDLTDADGILRLLRQVDAQMFAGYDTYDTFTDPSVVDAISRLAAAFQRTLSAPDGGAIVFVGAGTSGRIGTLAAHGMQHDIDTYGRGGNNNNNIDNTESLLLPECVSNTRCHSIMAGGSLAMVRAQESAEDSAAAGYNEAAGVVAAVEKEREFRCVGNQEDKGTDGDRCYRYHHVVVGITVGLSAPYVGGALEYAMEHNDTDNLNNNNNNNNNNNKTREITAVLITFNPLSCARNVPLNNTTLPRLSQDLHRHPKHIVVSPVTGPEAITGSTRMKGGTGTAIVINTAWTACIHRMMMKMMMKTTTMMTMIQQQHQHNVSSSGSLSLSAVPSSASTMTDTVLSILTHINTVVHTTYTSAVTSSLSSLMEDAAAVLRRRQHICYLAHGSLSPWAFVDAAECPPTFGADVHDVRGYVWNGWTSLGLPDLGDAGPDYRIDMNSFISEIAPTLNEGDLVVVLHPSDEGEFPASMIEAVKTVQQRGVLVRVVRIRTSCEDQDTMKTETSTSWSISSPSATLFSSFPINVDIVVPHVPKHIFPGTLGLHRDPTDSIGIAGKLVLNAVSTAAHVMSGTTYGNTMVSLRVSNSKLYNRSVAIVSRMSNTDPSFAERCLQIAIHDIPVSPSSPVPHHIRQLSVADHVETALPKDRIIPTAILLARGTVQDVAAAKEMLAACPVVRRVLDKVESCDM